MKILLILLSPCFLFAQIKFKEAPDIGDNYRCPVIGKDTLVLPNGERIGNLTIGYKDTVDAIHFNLIRPSQKYIIADPKCLQMQRMGLLPGCVIYEKDDNGKVVFSVLDLIDSLQNRIDSLMAYYYFTCNILSYVNVAPNGVIYFDKMKDFKKAYRSYFIWLNPWILNRKVNYPPTP